MSSEEHRDVEHVEPMSARKKAVIFLVCCVILGLAFQLSVYIYETRPKPERRRAEDMLVKVRVLPVVYDDHSIEFSLNGTVEPSKKLSLKSEISGLITDINPKVEIGQMVKKGEVLFTLEDIDYKSVLASSQAALAKAQMELEIEKGRQALSKQEWEMIQSEVQASSQEKKLALRKPQLAMALANEKAARAALQLAEKNLERTKISSPFEAMIIQKNVELGARISTQEELLMLAKSRPYWVRVTVPQDKLIWLNFATVDQPGSPASIMYINSSEQYTGQVLRFLPNMLESTRMAQLLVEVDPFQDRSTPLLLGSYVQVKVLGKALSQVVKVPRTLLREGSFLYVLNPDDKLEIRKVTYISSGRDDLLIQTGLSKGDRLITSQIPAPVEGMKLSVLKE